MNHTVQTFTIEASIKNVFDKVFNNVFQKHSFQKKLKLQIFHLFIKLIKKRNYKDISQFPFLTLFRKSRRNLSMNPYRSSRSQVFFKIGVIKNFPIFTGKVLCWSLSLIKMCFPVNIAKFLRTAFL